ncbi:hypothetical protein LWS69_22975, partial [Bordetella hinzii]|nr:hypothetical protein [Bordetella hinzii]
RRFVMSSGDIFVKNRPRPPVENSARARPATRQLFSGFPAQVQDLIRNSVIMLGFFDRPRDERKD